jgi:hypothetical protein
MHLVVASNHAKRGLLHCQQIQPNARTEDRQATIGLGSQGGLLYLQAKTSSGID